MEIKWCRNTARIFCCSHGVGLLIAVLVLPFVAGSAAAESSFDSPFVFLTIEHQLNQSICKGVAVSSHVVLTAAHCVVSADASEIRAHTTRQWLRPTKVAVHPRYAVETKLPHYDVALLTFDEVVTRHPLPVVTSVGVAPNATFLTLDLREEEFGSINLMRRLHVFRAADIDEMILNYVDERRGTFPKQKSIEQLETLLRQGNQRIKDKIANEFGGFLFSLYGISRTSICLGDSGTPAMIFQNGAIGIAGVATAVSQFEEATNPECPEGGTSIFTSLHQEEIVRFMREYDPSIAFL